MNTVAALSRLSKVGCALALAGASMMPASAQKYDLSLLFGGRSGGSVKLAPEGGATKGTADLSDGLIYGVAGGFRFDGFEGCDGCNLIEFRWLRQSSNLTVKDAGLFPTPLASSSGRPSVGLNHFLVDFIREFPIENSREFRPFALVTLGTTRLGTDLSSSYRLAFGIGGGINIFPKPNWGFRVQAEYLPTLMQGSVQKVVCSGGCIVTVNGGLLNQFQVTFGPTFRF